MFQFYERRRWALRDDTAVDDASKPRILGPYGSDQWDPRRVSTHEFTPR